MWFDKEANQQLLINAETHLSAMTSALYAAENTSAQSIQDKEAQDDAPGFRELQFILQYRLGNQDALQALLRCQHTLCQIIGVSPENSTEINYERLAYALGRDDLHVALTLLNQLSEALLQLLERLQRRNEVTQRKAAKSRKPSKAKMTKPCVLLLETADKEQAAFTAELIDLTLSLQGIEGAPDSEEVLDYLCCMQGPISRFYQALHNGMILSGSLYQQYSMNANLTPDLSQILDEVHQLLTNAAPHLEPQRFFSHLKAHHVSDENLENAAALLRTGNFFKPSSS